MIAYTETGLDRLVRIIESDAGLQRELSPAQIASGATAASNLNTLIVDGIRAMGLANDNRIDTADFNAIGQWIQADAGRYADFVAWHGKGGGTETGFQLVQAEDANTRLFDANAVDIVASAIYEIGFGTENGRLIDKDGNPSFSLNNAATWLDQLLSDQDMAALRNSNVDVDIEGTTGTGLDRLVEIINENEGLARQTARTDIAEGARAADALNNLIVDGIRAMGLVNDNRIDTADFNAIGQWIQADAGRYADFVAWHGKGGGTETGFQLVQGEDANARLFDANAVDIVASAIYEIGFGTENGRLIDKDGNPSFSLNNAATWLDQLLSDQDMASLRNPGVDLDIEGTTGTGLDRLVEIINENEGLARQTARTDIAEGARAADALNNLIVDGIREMGLANDGTIDAADVRALSEWAALDATRHQTIIDLYGTSRNGVETGFQLVQSEDANTRLFDTNAVDVVATAIYSFGFGYDDGRVINVDGNLSFSLNDAGSWIDRLLTDADMDKLRNPDVGVKGTTGTGLDRLVEVVNTDAGLVRNISQRDITEGAAAVDALNNMYLDAIRELGLANDNRIDSGDVNAISDWVRSDSARLSEFRDLHGSDENGGSGFHLVLHKGGEIGQISGVVDGIHPHKGHVISHAMKGLYQIGFGTDEGRLYDVEGELGLINVGLPATWLDQLLSDQDMASLRNPGVDLDIEGTTGTGLDRLVEIINGNEGLARQTARTDIAEGARAADALNNLIVDGIRAMGLVNDNRIDTADFNAIGQWIQADAGRYADFVAWHGKGGGTETGFQLVQGEDANARLFDANAVDIVASAIYEIGFGTENGRLIDKDGNPSFSLNNAATWLDQLLSDQDMASLRNPGVDLDIEGTTGTGLDRLVEIINENEGLARQTARTDIAEGARAADALNNLIVDGIREMGLANDGTIDAADVRALSEWAALDATRHQTIIDLYGTSRNGVETGFQLVQSEDANTRLFDTNAVDVVATAIYSFGFGYDDGRVINVDGNLSFSLNDAGSWIDRLLTDADMDKLRNPDVGVKGTTGTGLDRLVEVVNTDAGLVRNISQRDITEGAAAVDALNNMYLDAIRELGLANDNRIDSGDVNAISDWVRSDSARLSEFRDLHGSDENGGSGFHLVLHKGGEIGQISGVVDGIHPHKGHVISHAMKGLYQIGFGTDEGRLYDVEGELGLINVGLPATWLDQLLSDQDMASLRNPGVDLDIEGTTGTGLDRLVEIINGNEGLARQTARTDIAEGARAADALNNLIVDGIRAMGLVNDNRIDTADFNAIGQWIQADAGRYADFVAWHGKGGGTETGFQLVQGEDANARLFDANAVDIVASAIYEIGFGTENGRLIDKDGNPSFSLNNAATWLDQLLSDQDMASLRNPGVDLDIEGTTGTGLDRLVEIINEDPDMGTHTSSTDIAEGARAADALNNLIVDAIDTRGLGTDGRITETDVFEINAFIRSDSNRLDEFLTLRGNPTGQESGFHLVEGGGGTTRIFDNNAINNVADAIYHIGFEIEGKRFIDESNVERFSPALVAQWIDDLMF